MWTIFFVLPNIQVKEPTGNDWISIAPYGDSRVKENVDNSPYARALAEKFEDQFGRTAIPSFLIVADNIPDRVRNVEAIVGFRNIFALSTITRAHEHSLSNQFVAYPLYSDYFDFYPITVSRHNDGFITQSPSVLGFDDEYKKFRGQTTPSLAGQRSVSADPDTALFTLLLRPWEKRFLRGKTSEWSTTALFRSLEMAYQASTMPFKNHSTIYDYGSSASLWVSALEILSHPRKGKADLVSVLNLIGQFDWNNKTVKKKVYKISYRQKEHRASLPQRLYKELYDTRNEFLHGNPITPNRLHPFRNKDVPGITRFAPLLYKVALLAYLEKYKDRRKRKDWRKGYISALLSEERLSEAILKSVR
jgi:hypothetical protein